MLYLGVNLHIMYPAWYKKIGWKALLNRYRKKIMIKYMRKPTRIENPKKTAYLLVYSINNVIAYM